LSSSCGFGSIDKSASRTTLSFCRFRISEASDGLEAVKKAAALQPDVILLDIGLPSLNGMEAAKRIALVAPQAKYSS
jgi:CheY-like chemotaxis protein